MQSNLAIAEELMRISAYLNPAQELSCPDTECEQHGVAVDSPGSRYKKAGKSAAGTPRHQCLLCKATFSGGGKAAKRQRVTHKNRDVFMLLVNKSPLKRICAVTGLNMVTLYRRISFIHKQCLLFAGERESSLIDQKLATRYLATDRQMFTVNWTSRKDRRNVQLLAIATADIETGYVFGMHLNFDGKIDSETVAQDMLRYGDDHLPQPFRRYARIWLPQDYEKERRLRTAKDRAAIEAKSAEQELEVAIRRTYEDALDREDVESSDQNSPERQLPRSGVQVHEQVSMAAHIQLISRLLQGAEKLRFFVDQESGLRAAIMGALGPRITARTADAWYVQVLKETTVDVKRRALKTATERFAAAQLANSTLSEQEVELMLMKKQMAGAKEFGHWRDRWVEHPFPIMTEPQKRMCWLTDLGDYNEDHAARLYLKATLHSVDRYFMQVRRRLSLAERPIASANNSGRVWNGYAAYRPENLAMVLDIFRVYFNFCETGGDRKTPAMRLGLAKGRVALEDILYFVPAQAHS